jgi:hypothetical protein
MCLPASGRVPVLAALRQTSQTAIGKKKPTDHLSGTAIVAVPRPMLGKPADNEIPGTPSLF